MLLFQWRLLSMAPVSTALIRPLRLQRLCYVWIHLPASEKTAVQVDLIKESISYFKGNRLKIIIFL